MTVSVNFLIEFNGYSTLHAVIAVHFRYDRYMRRLVNEFLGRNSIPYVLPVTGEYSLSYSSSTRVTNYSVSAALVAVCSCVGLGLGNRVRVRNRVYGMGSDS